MKPFDIASIDDLAKLLRVHPHEIASVCHDRDRLYSTFRKRKGTSGIRTLNVPQGRLKLLQEKIHSHIFGVVKPLSCVHGGVARRSAITNARQHIKKEVVFCLDIADFFPSIDAKRVECIFGALGFRGEATRTLVRLTVWENQLPQGAPTSSGLANLAMTRIDARLQCLAFAHRITYTRFVDDLTFSGSKRLYKLDRLIQRIIEEEGFTVNPDKLRIMHAGMRQVVTNIVVNRKLNLTREHRKEIRRLVLTSARRGGDRSIDTSIAGRVSWLKSVNPHLGTKLHQIVHHA